MSNVNDVTAHFIRYHSGMRTTAAAFLLLSACSRSHASPSPVAVQDAAPEPTPDRVLSPQKRALVNVEHASTFAEAIKVSMPVYDAEASTDAPAGGVAAILVADWAAAHLALEDVAVAKNETSFAMVAKDADEERGKRLCLSGPIHKIKASKTKDGAKWFHGFLSASEGMLYFIAAGSTGALVAGSTGRFCGAVFGPSSYTAKGGDVARAVTAIGMFDLPENRRP